MCSGEIPALVRGDLLFFDDVALSPKLSHAEKIRLIVLLRHVWSDGSLYISEGLSQNELAQEIAEHSAEIEERMHASA